MGAPRRPGQAWRRAQAVTNRGSSPCSPPSGGCAWAPVPPQAADLTRPAGGAGIMPGRDEGTGASIEPRNNHQSASGLAVVFTRRLQSIAQCWVRLNYASHTEVRILPVSIRPFSVNGPCCVDVLASWIIEISADVSMHVPWLPFNAST